MAITLVLGGARSGKSSFAQKLVEKKIRDNGLSPSSVLYIATARPLDEEMEERIRHHRANRPRRWKTLEAPLNISGNLRDFLSQGRPDIVLLDCITVWLSNLVVETESSGKKEEEIINHVCTLVNLLQAEKLESVIVSNELGLGLVPPYLLGREYRDIAGRTNQIIARAADRVYLTVAGIPLDLSELRCRL